MSIGTALASAINIFQAGTNVELLTLLSSARSEYYVRILSYWQDEFECCGLLAVPTPLVFAYFSDVVLQDHGGASPTWHIAIIQYVVIALLCILGPARDGAVRIV